MRVNAFSGILNKRWSFRFSGKNRWQYLNHLLGTNFIVANNSIYVLSVWMRIDIRDKASKCHAFHWQ